MMKRICTLKCYCTLIIVFFTAVGWKHVRAGATGLLPEQHAFISAAKLLSAELEKLSDVERTQLHTAIVEIAAQSDMAVSEAIYAFIQPPTAQLEGTTVAAKKISKKLWLLGGGLVCAGALLLLIIYWEKIFGSDERSHGAPAANPIGVPAPAAPAGHGGVPIQGNPQVGAIVPGYTTVPVAPSAPAPAAPVAPLGQQGPQQGVIHPPVVGVAAAVLPVVQIPQQAPSFPPIPPLVQGAHGTWSQQPRPRGPQQPPNQAAGGQGLVGVGVPAAPQVIPQGHGVSLHGGDMGQADNIQPQQLPLVVPPAQAPIVVSNTQHAGGHAVADAAHGFNVADFFAHVVVPAGGHQALQQGGHAGELVSERQLANVVASVIAPPAQRPVGRGRGRGVVVGPSDRITRLQSRGRGSASGNDGQRQ